MSDEGLSAGASGRPAWTRVRAALEARGFRPSQRFGQNFLLDDNVLRAIVRDARLPERARVLEVGPGCGFLTLQLLRAGHDLVCVEVDPRLAEVARELLAGERPFELVRGDVLAGKHALSPEVERHLPRADPWHLVANLPYSIAGPLFSVLAALENPPESATVLVQREVADRLAAEPGTREFGGLTLQVQLLWSVAIGRSVGPDLFWPRPKVESVVVHLARRPDAPSRASRLAVAELARALLARRRQSLVRVLADLWGDRPRAVGAIAALGAPPDVRAESLPIEAWLGLARLAAP